MASSKEFAEVAHDIVGMAAIEIEREKEFVGKLLRFLEAAVALSDVAALEDGSTSNQYYASRVVLRSTRNGQSREMWSTLGPHETERATYLQKLVPSRPTEVAEGVTLEIPSNAASLEAFSRLRSKFPAISPETFAGIVLDEEYSLAPQVEEGEKGSYWAQDRFFESFRQVLDSVERIAQRRDFERIRVFGLKIQRYEELSASERRVWHPITDGENRAYVPFRLGNHVSAGALGHTLKVLTPKEFALLETPAGDNEKDIDVGRRTARWGTAHSSILSRVAAMHFRHDEGYGRFFPRVAHLHDIEDGKQITLEDVETKYWGNLPSERAAFFSPLARGKQQCSAAWYAVVPSQMCDDPMIVRTLLGLHYEIRDVFQVLVEDRLISELAREIASGTEGVSATIVRCELLVRAFLDSASESGVIGKVFNDKSETLLDQLKVHDEAQRKLMRLARAEVPLSQTFAERLELRSDLPLVPRLKGVVVRQGSLQGGLVTAVYRHLDRRLTREAAIQGEAYRAIKVDVEEMTRLVTQIQDRAVRVRVHVADQILPEITRAEMLRGIFGDSEAAKTIKIGSSEVNVLHNVIVGKKSERSVSPNAYNGLRTAAHYLHGCEDAECRRNHLRDVIGSGSVQPGWLADLPYDDVFRVLPCTYVKNACFRGDPPHWLPLDLVHFVLMTRGATFSMDPPLDDSHVDRFVPTISYDSLRRMFSAAVLLYEWELRGNPASQVTVRRSEGALELEFVGLFSGVKIAALVKQAVVERAWNRSHLPVRLASAIGFPESVRVSADSTNVSIVADNGSSIRIGEVLLSVVWPGHWGSPGERLLRN